jgi:carbon storage regulator
MLILKRRIGENLRIGANVSVTVQEVKGNQVKIGISAPRSLPIHREEIYVRIKKQLKAKA